MHTSVWDPQKFVPWNDFLSIPSGTSFRFSTTAKSQILLGFHAKQNCPVGPRRLQWVALSLLFCFSS